MLTSGRPGIVVFLLCEERSSTDIFDMDEKGAFDRIPNGPPGKKLNFGAVFDVYFKHVREVLGFLWEAEIGFLQGWYKEEPGQQS